MPNFKNKSGEDLKNIIRQNLCVNIVKMGLIKKKSQKHILIQIVNKL